MERSTLLAGELGATAETLPQTFEDLVRYEREMLRGERRVRDRR